MEGISFIQQSKITNLKGRIDYISNHERQEHLYATYSTADDSYWRDLAKENREDFKKSGTSGKCIEARELIIALPPAYYKYDYDQTLRYFVDKYKERYDVECTAALHHNARMNNLHIHLIYSERKELAEPEVKIASRNRYYDPYGKHLRSKKEASDEHGNLLPGYKVIKKGEVYEQHRFEKKKDIFKSAAFLDDVKVFMTNLMNERLPEHAQKMYVFPKNSPYLPTKKIGKHNPKVAEIRENNKLTDRWNKEIWQARAYGVPKKSLMETKKQLITEPVRQSISKSSSRKNPVTFRNILIKAVETLGIMLLQHKYMSRDDWAKAWGEALREFISGCINLATGIKMSMWQNDKNR